LSDRRTEPGTRGPDLVVETGGCKFLASIVARTYNEDMKRIALMLVLAGTLSAASGCYGSYGAFNAVHKWNGRVTNSKIVNSAVHIAFWLPLPVYELVLLGDFLIFNNIEFLTGAPVFT
jgi:hypothetical protein